MLSATEACMLKLRHPKVASKIDFIYNSIKLPSSFRKEGSRECIRVVFAGRLVEEKGIRTFIDLARKQRERRQTFHIFGNGPLLDLVSLEVSRNDNLFYEGVFSISGALEALQNFDVLVLPSLSGEGMPMVILEAMSCGVVPIATQLGSIPEIIASGDRGYLISPGDVDLCAQLIDGLDQDPELLSAISDRAKLYAKDNFNAKVNTKGFLEVYRKLSCRNDLAKFRS
ncbi:MAG: glycosyltransferase family 4 protein [bacterium]|nr:glycosyltransferase family 4 protein [bacterium]